MQHKPMVEMLFCPEVEERERRKGAEELLFLPPWVDEARETEEVGTG